MPFPDDTTPEMSDSQLQTLKEIQAILNGSKTGAAPLATTPGTGTARTVAIATVSTNGSVAAGKRGIEFIFASDFVGTIDGDAFTGANDASWSAPALQGNDTYAALAYTISAGSARLVTLT